MVLVCKVKRAWIEVEKEHTNKEWLAKKIAQDHVNEFGCKYYPALKRMEKRLKK
jgi:hypothetical protein